MGAQSVDCGLLPIPRTVYVTMIWLRTSYTPKAQPTGLCHSQEHC